MRQISKTSASAEMNLWLKNEIHNCVCVLYNLWLTWTFPPPPKTSAKEVCQGIRWHVPSLWYCLRQMWTCVGKVVMICWKWHSVIYGSIINRVPQLTRLNWLEAWRYPPWTVRQSNSPKRRTRIIWNSTKTIKISPFNFKKLFHRFYCQKWATTTYQAWSITLG